MATLNVFDHVSLDELDRRAEQASNRDEWRRWRAIAMKARSMPARQIALVLSRKEDWVRRTVRDYNALGPESVADGRERNGKQRYLLPEHQGVLRHAIEHEEPPGDGRWTGEKVVVFCGQRFGRAIKLRAAYKYLHRLPVSWRVPGPQHEVADALAQEAFSKRNSARHSRHSNQPTRRRPSSSGRKTRPGSG